MELREYQKLFSLSLDAFIECYNVSAANVHTHLRYEKLADVSRVDGVENEFFFFKDDLLTIIYISNELITNKLWNEFKLLADIDQPEHEVRSRAGKTSQQLIFASHGVTASISRDEVDFVELYTPCTVQEYLNDFYQEPGVFIR